MTHRHARDRSRLSRAEAERVLDGEPSTAPIATLLTAATGPPRMREQASEFFVRAAYRAAETPTEPAPAARSARHAAAAPPSVWARAVAAAAALSRLVSPRMLVGAIAGAAAVGVVVAMYTGSLSQPGLPDTTTAPAARAPQPPGAQQIPSPEGVPAPVPAAPDSPGQVAAGPAPPGPPTAGGTAGRAASRPGPAAVPAARSGADSGGGSGGSSSGGSGSAGSSDSGSAGSSDSGGGGSAGGGSSRGSLVEVNVLGIELSL